MRGAIRASVLIAAVVGLGLALVLGFESERKAPRPIYGATFSPEYARFLGFDPRAVFIAILDDLRLQHIRLPVHWNVVQPEPSQNNFTELDWLMAEAAKRNVKVVLAIGNKVPRWPECYTPAWARTLSASDYEQALLNYMDTLVTRYRTHPALERWQVENEILFPFGKCPIVDYPLVKREIAHVRALDPHHQIQLTVSGEQQFWVSLAFEADVIGTSMYRKVALPNGWWLTFPIPPYLYTLQALSVALFVDQTVISELQAEPWLFKDFRAYTVQEAAQLFTPQQLQAYLRYAEHTGLKEISLWGVEWWYYLKQNGYPELWDTGREYFK